MAAARESAVFFDVVDRVWYLFFDRVLQLISFASGFKPGFRSGASLVLSVHCFGLFPVSLLIVDLNAKFGAALLKA